MEKMTNKKALEFVLSLQEVVDNVEVCEKLQKMLEQVEKKNAKSDTKPTKAQLENVELKDKILVAMSEFDEPCQIKDICGVLGYSNQKISALVRQLVASGAVERLEEKKVAKFRLV